MDINYELYKVFYQVASTLSFSEASRQLYISQSAVSQSIKSLEQKLGHALFIRSTKKVSLTPEGETLYRHITPAIHMIQSAETQIMEKIAYDGQIRIGAGDTICRYFLIPYLNRFHTEYPNVHIKIINQPSSTCLEMLKQNQVDFIIVNSPIDQVHNYRCIHTVQEFQDVFVVNPNYFKFNNNSLSLEQLREYPLIMLEKSTTSGNFFHQYVYEQGYSITPEIELNSNDLVFDLTNIGLGIGLLPDYMLKQKNMDLKIIGTEFHLPKRQLILMTNHVSEKHSILNEFLHYFL